MNVVMTVEDRLPVDLVQMLVDRHGLWRVVRAVLRAAVRPRFPVRHVDLLSDHLRRDIGLPPIEPGPAGLPLRR